MNNPIYLLFKNKINKIKHKIKQNYNNQKAQYNLKICRAKLKLDTEPNELFIFIFMKKIIFWFSQSTLTLMLIISSAFFCIAYVFYLKKNNILYKQLFKVALLLFGILLILLMLQVQIKNKNNTYIIYTDHVMGYKNVSKNGKGIELKKGEVVIFLESFNQQIQIETESGEKLWIETGEVKCI